LLFCLVTFAPYHPETSEDAAASSLSGASASMLILEFYPRGLCSDEYVALFNAGGVPLNLRNWSVSDGEGTVFISKDCWVPPGGRASMSFNSSSYQATFGVLPTLSLDNGTSPETQVTGTFRMGDQGDSLCLIDPRGGIVDAARYGNSTETMESWSGVPIPVPRQGEVLRRVPSPPSYCDTDSWLDWAPFREYRYGYTELQTFQTDLGPGQITAFTSPDSSLAVLTDCIERAQHSATLCAYEFSSEAICRSLVGALSHGVAVKLLVDGAPVGGLSPEEKNQLSVLANCGAEVRVLSGNLSDDVVQHVGHLHAKYAVFDGRESVVLSENFVETAFPADQLIGNRGWGVTISDQSVASHLESMFQSDSRITRPDVHLWGLDPRHDASAALPPANQSSPFARVIEPLKSASPSTVRVYVSPDCSWSEPFLCDLLSGARSVLSEQFQTDLYWSTRWCEAPSTSPIVSSIAGVLQNGFVAKALFDSSWFNEERNTATCDYLRSVAAGSVGTGEFRMMDSAGPVDLLHNKGMVIDERLSVISSNNWVFASFARNRELALVIDSPEMASFFSGVFQIDWDGDETAPVADAGEEIVVRLGERAILNGSSSTDNRVISSWSWDLYSDGEQDGSAPVLEFFAIKPGQHEAVLTVEDPWGNRDTDVVRFTVLPAYDEQSRTWFETHVGWLLAGLCATGCVIGVLIARKVNHRLPD